MFDEGERMRRLAVAITPGFDRALDRFLYDRREDNRQTRETLLTLARQGWYIDPETPVAWTPALAAAIKAGELEAVAEALSAHYVGLHGNTHLPFADLNNREVADLLSQFLHEKRLDRRGHQSGPHNRF